MNEHIVKASIYPGILPNKMDYWDILSIVETTIIM